MKAEDGGIDRKVKGGKGATKNEGFPAGNGTDEEDRGGWSLGSKG